ncbi:unnamed protein product [Pleuronectes platessa]|uniref:Uncharacterized protein n=1 Tax=Pleuronectes platessa TaxID=8262 RepID=A0A9N7VMK7_PLEPL|nr:unnamed protein product [Pleuronectes platessa]
MAKQMKMSDEKPSTLLPESFAGLSRVVLEISSRAAPRRLARTLEISTIVDMRRHSPGRLLLSEPAQRWNDLVATSSPFSLQLLTLNHNVFTLKTETHVQTHKRRSREGRAAKSSRRSHVVSSIDRRDKDTGSHLGATRNMKMDDMRAKPERLDHTPTPWWLAAA